MMNCVKVRARDGLWNATNAPHAMQGKPLKGTWCACLEVNNPSVETWKQFLESVQDAVCKSGFFGFVISLTQIKPIASADMGTDGHGTKTCWRSRFVPGWAGADQKIL